MPTRVYFGPGFFKFLNDLKKHNDRDWFLANQTRYEKEVRQPFFALIADLAPSVAKLGSGFIADPHPTRGSMLRIYRDIRFSKNKSPYKTHVAAHFMHGRGKSEGIGLYLHLGPVENFAGGGVYRPEPAVLKKIRNGIVNDPAAWKRVVKGQALGGESLTRPPKGYDANHPFIEDIKRKDFYSGSEFSAKEVSSDKFFAAVLQKFRAATPLAEFLASAVAKS
jgi:uncharacterized protein (TIGR02453 family)